MVGFFIFINFLLASQIIENIKLLFMKYQKRCIKPDFMTLSNDLFPLCFILIRKITIDLPIEFFISHLDDSLVVIARNDKSARCV